MRKRIVSLIIAGSLLLCGAVCFAANRIEDVVAQINYGISMKLNGAPYNPTETDGSVLRPLIYKSRTYLPVAALGKALGVPVSWDASTSTVLIGESEKKTISGTFSEKWNNGNVPDQEFKTRWFNSDGTVKVVYDLNTIYGFYTINGKTVNIHWTENHTENGIIPIDEYEDMLIKDDDTLILLNYYNTDEDSPYGRQMVRGYVLHRWEWKN